MMGHPRTTRVGDVILLSSSGELPPIATSLFGRLRCLRRALLTFRARGVRSCLMAVWQAPQQAREGGTDG